MRRMKKVKGFSKIAKLTVSVAAVVCITLMPILEIEKQNVYAEDVNNNYADYIQIGSYEDLLTIQSNPSGKYVLVNDIDMASKEWKPVNFSGVFEGNGHGIINLTINAVTPETEITYDGNMKTYDTHFAGLFGIIKNAVINNLTIVNERITVADDNNCFVAGLAGYSDKSTISNCNIAGTYELTTGSHMFGAAGVVGFGNGTVENSNVDVTLICTDTNVADKDEQFMGGVIADGYMTVSNCKVTIAGFDSDHGYVHDGGIIGMNMPYPKGSTESGNIRNCDVSGFISFFEDNTDRRAYCSAIYGEMLGGLYVSNNTESFIRDEKFDYSVNLRPDQCTSPAYSTTVVEPDCNNYGYTLYTCSRCGYSYKDNFVLKKHQVNQYKVIKEPTYESAGLEEGTCELCGQKVTRSIDKLVAVDSCTISQQQLSLKKNETAKLNITVSPLNATVKDEGWSTSNDSVVTVGKDGKVTAVGKGEAVITYSVNGSQKAKCTVSVKNSSTAVAVIIIAVVVGIVAVITGIMYQNEMRKRRRRKRRKAKKM